MYLKFFRINTKHANEWDEHNLTQNVEVLQMLNIRITTIKILSICEAYKSEDF